MVKISRAFRNIKGWTEFKKLLKSPNRLHYIISSYLEEVDVPTVPGLCSELGITVDTLKKLFKHEKEFAKIPDDSLEILGLALQEIEVHLLKRGLEGTYNANLLRHVLSIYHGRREVVEQKTQQDTNILIVMTDPNKIEVDEVKNLETYIENSRDQELLIETKPQEDFSNTNSPGPKKRLVNEKKG